jgi:hypothetical protein
VSGRAGSRWVILLSIVAATAVGANLIGIEKAVALSDETSVLWPIAAARSSALDLAANVLYGHATQETLLSVAAGRAPPPSRWRAVMVGGGRRRRPRGEGGAAARS